MSLIETNLEWKYMPDMPDFFFFFSLLNDHDMQLQMWRPIAMNFCRIRGIWNQKQTLTALECHKTELVE